MRARFFDGRRALPHQVDLAVADGRVVIRSVDGDLDLTWDLARLSARADPDGAVIFRQPRGLARLVVDDADARELLRPAVGKWSGQQSGWGLVAFSVLAVAAFAVLVVGWLPSMLAPLVPDAWQQSLGAGTQAALVGRHRICTGTDGQRALETFVARIAAGGAIPGAVRIHVVDDGTVNAFTLPGNRVLLMRGLIATAADGDELAGVVAHELGHVSHRDPTKELLRRLGLGAVGVAFGWNGMSSGTLATTLLGLSYGRAAETAADAFAIESLRRAGLRADGLGRFFERMQADGPAGLGFLSDHPPTAERRARARQPPDGIPAFEDAQWRAIRGMCDKGVE